jgi:16S rRNA (guanine527-N7)-methyltransferase
MQTQLIKQYFPDLSQKQIEQFQALPRVYKEWNAKINVVSRKDIDQLVINHILHSLAIAKFIQFNDNTQIVDIGTGGGFPGIPLAIMFPKCQFTLVDSIAKKITVVNEVIKAIDLKNATAIQSRIEELDITPDFYTCRAVAKLDELVKWINKKISPSNFNQMKNGLIALKGGELSDELLNFPNADLIPVSKYFKEQYFETKMLIYTPIN